MNLDPGEIKRLWPVEKIHIYPSGWEVERGGQTDRMGLPVPGKRGRITRLSSKSRCKMAWVVSNTKVEFSSLLTLCYGASFPSDGQRLRRDRNRILQTLRRWHPSLNYFWVLEFQVRGAPHLHVMLDKPDKVEQSDRHRLAKVWAKHVEPYNFSYYSFVSEKYLRTRDATEAFHRRSKQWEMIRKRRGAQRYLMKYALKTEQKKVPVEYSDVGRFWGCSRQVRASIERQDTIDVSDDEEAARYLKKMGREDVASWDILPRYVFKKRGKE